jgi:hypothetical protein
MKNKIWDLKPDGGGSPIVVTMKSDYDASEAIARDPDRYTREPPEGTPEYERLEKDRAHAAKLAEISASESKAMAEITAAEREHLKKIADEKAEAKRAADEKAREEYLKDHPELAHDAEIARIKSKAHADRERIRMEHDQHRAELAKEHAA